MIRVCLVYGFRLHLEANLATLHILWLCRRIAVLSAWFPPFRFFLYTQPLVLQESMILVSFRPITVVMCSNPDIFPPIIRNPQVSRFV